MELFSVCRVFCLILFVFSLFVLYVFCILFVIILIWNLISKDLLFGKLFLFGLRLVLNKSILLFLFVRRLFRSVRRRFLSCRLFVRRRMFVRSVLRSRFCLRLSSSVLLRSRLSVLRSV